MKIKHFALKLIIVCGKALYWLMKLFPVKKQVTLITRRSTKTSQDFLYLTEQIKLYSPHTTVRVLNHKIEKIVWYPFQMLKEMWCLARSQVVILDSYIPTVSLLKHRKTLPVVQIWHAIGAIKKFGYGSLDTLEGTSSETARLLKMHRNYTAVTASSEKIAKTFAESFGVPKDKVVTIGTPRIDYLRDKTVCQHNREQILETVRLDTTKKTVLYLPTFRKDRTVPVQELAKAIDKDNWQIVYSPHPLDNKSRSNLQQLSNIISGENFEAQQLLSIADAVITDYSAVVYEATLVNIPTLFWWFDSEEYLHNRGITIDSQRLKAAGLLFSDVAELSSQLNNLHKNGGQEISPVLNEEFSVAVHNCTRQLLELVGLEQGAEL